MDSSSVASDPLDSAASESKRPRARLTRSASSDVDETAPDRIGAIDLTRHAVTLDARANQSITLEAGAIHVLPGLPNQAGSTATVTTTTTRTASRPSSASGSDRGKRKDPRPGYMRTISHEQHKHGKNKVDNQQRRRTRTMEEGVATTQMARREKNRQRVGSVQEATIAPTTEYDDGEVSSSNQGESSHKSSSRKAAAAAGRPTIPPRKASNRAPSHSGVSGTSTTQKLIAQHQPPDPRTSLQLMSTTRGRMQGPLFFREGNEGSWFLSHCFISTETGSLLCETSYGRAPGASLVPDLRGVQVQVSYDDNLQTAVLNVKTDDIPKGVQLRPMEPANFDFWFAALLCWQPVNIGVRFKTGIRRQIPAAVIDLSTRGKFALEGATGKDGSIIKVGKAWILAIEHEEYLSDTNHHPKRAVVRWNPISCVLYQNALLKICTVSEVTTIAKVRLSKLPRNALQRLDASVLNTDHCVAIYPQYARSTDACSRVRPMFLTFENRVIFEVWFVLFRAFMVPEIFGQRQSDTMGALPSSELLPGLSSDLGPSVFRIERSLSLKISEAKVYTKRLSEAEGSSDSSKPRSRGGNTEEETELYVQVVLDGQVKAKTTTRETCENPAWYESFDIHDLGSLPPFLSIQIMKREVTKEEEDEPSQNMILSPYTEQTNESTFGVPEPEIGVLIGETDFDLNKVEPNVTSEHWYPILDGGPKEAGKILLRIRSEQDIVLMDAEYQQVSELLHDFSNGLTWAIADKIPSNLSEVSARLSYHFLNIFQASGSASEWLMALAEEEVDGTRRDMQAGKNKLRYAGRVGSNEAKEASGAYGLPPDREGLVRDLGKSVTAEANLLFRGNTLLSKSLDSHMRRVGKEYLEDTLGTRMRGIAGLNPDCEVDPNKMTADQNLQRNWRRLISLTQEVWNAIAQSAPFCPNELRVIFRHIRACAEDRYGDFMRNVTYSSVSGFLFLRFLCPAILNPRVFALVKDHPKPRAQRTFTLIVKGLQCLANLTTFGAKEKWMEPMNQFVNSHRQAFKNFIDGVCSIPSDQSTTLAPPSYSTPRAIFTRVPAAYREGYPSLPYLVDPTRDFASLVNLWLDNCGSVDALDGELLHFHTLCVSLRQRTKEAYELAERIEKRSSSLSKKWVGIAERMEASPWIYWIDDSESRIARKDMASPPRTASDDEGETGNNYGQKDDDTDDNFDSSHQLTSTTSSDDEGAKRSSSRRRKQKEKDRAKFGLFHRKRPVKRRTE